jgi:hypothetical protein
MESSAKMWRMRGRKVHIQIVTRKTAAPTDVQAVLEGVHRVITPLSAFVIFACFH